MDVSGLTASIRTAFEVLLSRKHITPSQSRGTSHLHQSKNMAKVIDYPLGANPFYILTMEFEILGW